MISIENLKFLNPVGFSFDRHGAFESLPDCGVACCILVKGLALWEAFDFNIGKSSRIYSRSSIYYERGFLSFVLSKYRRQDKLRLYLPRRFCSACLSLTPSSYLRLRVFLFLPTTAKNTEILKALQDFRYQP